MQILETGLVEVETDEHAGDKNHGSARCNCGNCRDGTRSKLVITEVGSVDIDVRRDRNRCSSPQQ